MSARTPRRSFANPFVVTLAAAPACWVNANPPPPMPPQQQQQQQPVQDPIAEPPPNIVANPPRPMPPSTQQQTQQSWTVFKTADGCMAAVKAECPPKASCNPPPPMKYACPDGVSLDKPITIVTVGDGSCIVQPEPIKCPPGAMCNPPRPRALTCPQ